MCSISFSVPRCSRPMCGSTRSTTSPSSSSTRRSTPCAAGCCGPKFRWNWRISVSAMASPLRLLIPRQHVVGPLPRAHEVEGAELLGQLHRLVDHALLRIVVAHLDIAGEREVLAQRVALEAVVGEDAPAGPDGPRTGCRTCRRPPARTSWRRETRRRRSAPACPRRSRTSRGCAGCGAATAGDRRPRSAARARDSRRRRCRSAPRTGIANRRAGSVSTRTIFSRATTRVSSPRAIVAPQDGALQLGVEVACQLFQRHGHAPGASSATS